MKYLKIIALNIWSISVYSQANINGVFFMEKTNYYNDANILQSLNGVAACFDYTASQTINYNSLDTVEKISFNNEILSLNQITKTYSKNNIASLSTKNWAITGLGTIPNMNFLYGGVIPNFNINSNFISANLVKSDTLFVTLTGLQNADSVIIMIQDDIQLATQQSVYYKSPNYSNTYYLPPTLLSGLSVGPRGLIKIEVINYNYQSIAGKIFLFRNIYGFVKNNITISN